MSAVDRALRHIEKLIAARRRRPATAKAAPKPRHVQVRRVTSRTTARTGAGTPIADAAQVAPHPDPHPSPHLPPRSDPDFTPLVETFAPPFIPEPVRGPVIDPDDMRENVNFSGLVERDGMAFHKAGVILPNGEVADDWLDAPLPGWAAPWTEDKPKKDEALHG